MTRGIDTGAYLRLQTTGEGSGVAACVLCNEDVASDEAYSRHLANQHGLVDDEEAPPVGAKEAGDGPTAVDETSADLAGLAALHDLAVDLRADNDPEDPPGDALLPSATTDHDSVSEARPEATGWPPKIARSNGASDQTSAVSSHSTRGDDRSANSPARRRPPAATTSVAGPKLVIGVAALTFAAGLFIGSRITSDPEPAPERRVAASVVVPPADGVAQGGDRAKVAELRDRKFVLVGLDVSSGPDGRYAAWARIRNDESFSRSAEWTIILRRDGSVVGEVRGAALAVGPRQVTTIAMRSDDRWRGPIDEVALVTDFVS